MRTNYRKLIPINECKACGITKQEIAELCFNPKRYLEVDHIYRNRKDNRTPVTKMAAISQLRETFIKAQEYLNKDDNPRNLSMESIGLMLDRKIPVRIQANSPGDIRSAMNLASEFEFDLI